MILHELITGHLFVIVDFLAKLDHFRQWILAFVEFRVADIARAFEYCVAVLWVRVGHVEHAAAAVRAHGGRVYFCEGRADG